MRVREVMVLHESKPRNDSGRWVGTAGWAGGEAARGSRTLVRGGGEGDTRMEVVGVGPISCCQVQASDGAVQSKACSANPALNYSPPLPLPHSHPFLPSVGSAASARFGACRFGSVRQIRGGALWCSSPISAFPTAAHAGRRCLAWPIVYHPVASACVCYLAVALPTGACCSSANRRRGEVRWRASSGNTSRR